MSAITTHVLDIASGRPASGIPVRLEIRQRDSWKPLGRGRTDEDGRITDLVAAEGPPEAAVYRLVFQVHDYLEELGHEPFYEEIHVTFRLSDPEEHYHVPLLLSPFGYSTYRGS